MVEDRDPTGTDLWLVDGYNVLCTALRARQREAWWGAAERDALVRLAEGLDDPAARIWVAFDGPRPLEESICPTPGPRERVRRVFAESADAWLVERVKRHPDPARVVMVTADRELAGRARSRGARVVAPAEFAVRCGLPRGPAGADAAGPLKSGQDGRNRGRFA